MEQDREEESPASRCFPAAAEASASMGLEIRCNGRSLRLVVPDQALRGSALRDEAVRPPETAAQQWLDRAGR
jgi:hypothetical protein